MREKLLTETNTNTTSVVNVNVDREERKVLIKRAKQVFSWKNSTSNDFINYIDQVVTSLKALA